MTLVEAIIVGALIGLSLGAVGGGGSILTVPALVFVIGQPVRAATTDSLVIVGATAGFAALGYACSDRVRWGTGVAFVATGVLASGVGTVLNHRIDAQVLLLAFAGLTVVAATAMWRRSPPQGVLRSSQTRTAAGLALVEVNNEPDDALNAGDRRGWNSTTVAKVTTTGLGVGFLTGFFGVGGGFVIVPALVMALGLEMSYAVGTSLVVIAINSALALVVRAGSETFHWSVIVPVSAGAICSSMVGRSIAERVPGVAVTRAFVGLLYAVAIYTAARSATAVFS